jgi:hypothetical protein
MPPIWFINCIPYASITLLPVWTWSRLRTSRHLYSPCSLSISIAWMMSFCCCDTFSLSGSPFQTSHRTCSASSLRPRAYSHRGDSGIPKTMMTTTFVRSQSYTATATHICLSCLRKRKPLGRQWVPAMQLIQGRSSFHSRSNTQQPVHVSHILPSSSRQATHNTNANKQRLRRHQSSSALSITEFTLIHRYCARLDPSTDTCNVPGDHDLGHGVRCALQYRADDL